MGASGSSASKLGLDAEAKLFDIGIKLWRTWLPKSSATIVAESVDIELPPSAQYGERRIHGVWCHKRVTEAPAGPAAARLQEAVKADGPPVICLHGYGAGAGLYYASVPGLALQLDRPVYAIDWLGAGFSSRPEWKDVFKSSQASPTPAESEGSSAAGAAAAAAEPTPTADGQPSVEEVENFFVDAVEDLRVQLGSDKIVLLGHSLGGYIACAYAERHPERVERLVLAGCAGVPDQPPDAPNNRRAPGWVRVIGKWMWQAGISPFQLVQWFGEWGIGYYVDKRFEDHSWLDKPLIKNYLYNNWRSAPPSIGGHAHTSLLKQGAWARKPLEHRIPAMTNVKDINFVYGEHDWMTPAHAVRVQTAVNGAAAATGNGGAARPNITVTLVDNAGHQALLERPYGFVDACVAAISGNECDGKRY